MAHIVGADDIESMRIELAEMERSLRRSSPSSSGSVNDDDEDNGSSSGEEHYVKWAEIERLPTFKRMKLSLFDEDGKGKKVVDITKLKDQEKHVFIHKLIQHIENDNLRLLRKIRDRIDKVGVKLPSVEVRYKSLCVEAKCKVVHGKPLPTLWNSLISTFMNIAKLGGLKPQEATVKILNDVTGVIKPGRITILLGPPGCGKTTLLKALSGSLTSSLKVAGEVSYNGYKLHEFVPHKSSAYISQSDVHLPEMTVRETLDFSCRCHGVGSRADIMNEVSRREKGAGIIPDPDVDAYMKAISLQGLKRTLQTDYILKILGLDICADTFVGDPIRRGVSGGQKRRLTTGEMIVGPTKVLFMDEITNGLDSSTAFQIVACVRDFVHITDATVLISLLQPAPEVFDLFDDIILMAEEKIVYQGPRNQVLDFFEDCGFRCPERKGVADFLQEVISMKDQAQYWYKTDQPYSYLSASVLSRMFEASPFGKKISEELSEPYDKSQSHEDALSFSLSSLPKRALLRTCISRELLLMRRNSFLYVFKTCQLIVMALVAMTVFLQTNKKTDILQANYYMSSMYYSLVIFLLDTLPELSMVVARLPVFYKQKELGFYPAWAYAIPATILKIPLSFVQSLIWTSLTYFVIGYSPEVQRFFIHLIILFATHFASISMFRFIASVFQTSVASLTAGSLAIMFVLGCGGFLIELPSMPVWLKWGFWASPYAYAQIGLSVNEFHAPRWEKMIAGNTTIGQELLENRGLDFDGYFIWIAVVALFGFALLFNIGFILALSFFNYRGSTRRIISHEEVNQEKINKVTTVEENPSGSKVTTVEENPLYSVNAIAKIEKGTILLPFKPLTVAFQDVQYYVDTPLAMRKNGFNQKKLQLLHDVTGTLKPGILTALMGASGAGKTTLLDVLAGRKTSGYVKGEIRIGGYPKVQETFARISAYCEQSDIHSPQITVEESVLFSAWLRLSPQIDSKTKTEFVKEVLETVELDEIKDVIVGVPGLSGLSNEQRKRLTIAVELVANPSIIFMDEPTTGLDARAAAIVMRAVKNIADKGRTIVCTIHQPSIDIFEAFDELILLKNGGRTIYSGPLGHNSSKVIEYFEGIPGVPKIKDNYNPATWMLDVSSTSAEVKFGVDFAQIFKSSSLHENNKELVKQLSTPPPGATNLKFDTRFSLNGWGQFKACLWKQCLSYWRSPPYNYKRIMMTTVASFFFGLLYFGQGKELENQQSLFKMFGALYQGVIFIGVNNFTSVLPYVSTERSVMYRERFAGMYSSWAYSLAQVMIEIPYIFIQVAMNVIITYPMLGYYVSAYKIFWYFYAMFCAMLTYNYVGMLMVSLSPNLMVATTISSSILTSFNLFSGFIIPRTKIPKWWIWMYYLIPTSWSLNGLLTSQYGDIKQEINVFGETTTVAAFLKDYFGFDRDFLPIVAIVLIVYPLVLASLFAYLIGKLNFQRR